VTAHGGRRPISGAFRGLDQRLCFRQGRDFVKKFDKRSRNLNEFANERAFVFVFVFVKDGQPTSVSVKGYQGVSDWRVR
jgi:hypothetical protein